MQPVEQYSGKKVSSNNLSLFIFCIFFSQSLWWILGEIMLRPGLKDDYHSLLKHLGILDISAEKK